MPLEPFVVQTEADLDRICSEEHLQPRRRPINVDAARTPAEALAVLNTLTLWDNRIRWAAFRRRGNTIIGVTEDGEEAYFDADKLTRFAHAQARILDALAICIRSPRRGQINETWGMVAELIVRAAGADRVDAGRPEDDLRADLCRCWRAAGKPEVLDEDQLREHLCWIDGYHDRRPHDDCAPRAVVVYNADAVVHVPTFRTWASTPTGCARFYSLPEIREKLALLGFRSHRFQLGVDDERSRVTVWVGPRGLVEEQEG